MSTLRTPATVHARMVDLGFTRIRETKFGIEYDEPSWAEPEAQRLKAWVRANYAAFAAHLRELAEQPVRKKRTADEDQQAQDRVE